MTPRSLSGRPRPRRAEVFVLPEDRASPSGGNIYNSRLLAALKKAGFSFTTMILGEALAHALGGGHARYWVDSLYLEALEDPAALRLLGPEVFFIIHHLPSLEPGLELKHRRSRILREGRVLNAAAGHLATGALTRRVLRGRGIPAARLFLVPPALAAEPRGKKPGGIGFRGLIVSNLIRRKGVLEFLAGLGKRLAGPDRLSLRIAGRSDIEPDYAAACLEEIRRQPRLERSVRYLGPRTPAEIKDLYESSTVFITASLVETYGMAFHEAMAFGLPVLAVRAAYAEPFVRPGRNGRLYATIADLSRGCLDLARNPASLKKLRDSAWRGRSRPDYTWGAAARLFISQVSERENPPWDSPRP